jgi:hypothetical protein
LFTFDLNNLVSHSNWINDNSLIIWADAKPNGQHYYILEDFNSTPIKIIGESVLTEDGHPTISPNGDFLITDTYNDIFRRRSLIYYNIKNNVKTIIGKYYSPFFYSGSLRCDLHPRLNFQGTKICFDSAMKNERQVYIFEL